MKGLIRNNFYTVESSLKATLLISFAVSIVLAIVAKVTGDSGSLFSFIIAGNLGGFGSLAATALQKDAASKWDKFELTMPISRKDVVTAQYISNIFYVLIGVLASIVGVFVFYLATGSVNWERANYGFAFGIGFALSMPTFMHPLLMIFGTDKTEPFLLAAIIMGFVLFFGSSAVITPFLKDAAHADFIFRAGYVVFSIALFAISYLLSCRIYKKKELN